MGFLLGITVRFLLKGEFDACYDIGIIVFY